MGQQRKCHGFLFGLRFGFGFGFAFGFGFGFGFGFRFGFGFVRRRHKKNTQIQQGNCDSQMSAVLEPSLNHIFLKVLCVFFLTKKLLMIGKT